MRRLLSTLVVCLLVLGLTSIAVGTTVKRLTDEELVGQADAIVVGQCIGVKSEWLDRILITRVTIQVSETLKGPSAETISVVLPGGIDANRKFPVSMTYAGAPKIYLQENVFLFLSREEQLTDAYTVTGFSQGKYSIVSLPDGTQAVARDLSQVTFVDRGGQVRGSATAIPLQRFRAKVRSLLQK